MALGSKERVIGTVITKKINIGTKSEHTAIMLRPDDGGPDLEIRVSGANPFDNKELKRFLDFRVSIKGIRGSGRDAIFIDDISDITEIGPPGRPLKPRICGRPPRP